MEGIIVDFFIKVFSFLDAGWCFIITLTLILSLFIANLIFFLKSKKNLFKRKRGIGLMAFSLILFQAFSLAVVGKTLSLALFNFAVYLLFVSISSIIEKDKKMVITEEQRKAVKKFELMAKDKDDALNFSSTDSVEEGKEEGREEVKKSVLFSFENILSGENEKGREGLLESKVIKATQEMKKPKSVDYSGVKKAICETLNEDISSEDRKRLLYLDFLIAQTERGNEKNVIKEEINEGLSALLKIISENKKDLLEKS